MNNLRLTNLTKIKVSQLMEHKNQYLITFVNSEGHIFYAFQSYNSLVAVFDVYNGLLYVSWRYWDYSATTLKHFKHFVNNYTGQVYENKAQFITLIKKGVVIAF